MVGVAGVDIPKLGLGPFRPVRLCLGTLSS